MYYVGKIFFEKNSEKILGHNAKTFAPNSIPIP